MEEVEIRKERRMVEGMARKKIQFGVVLVIVVVLVVVIVIVIVVVIAIVEMEKKVEGMERKTRRIRQRRIVRALCLAGSIEQIH